MKRLFYLLTLLPLLTSCFKDTGNYKYHEINAPKWKRDFNNQPQHYNAYAGDSLRLRGDHFFVPKEGEEEAKENPEMHYEWVLNNKVIAEGFSPKIATEEAMKRAEIKIFSPVNPIAGTLNITEKATGIRFMGKFIVNFRPYFSVDDWFALVDKEGATSITAVRRRSQSVDGKVVSVFSVEQDAFELHNNGKTIPGKPLHMNWSFAKDISSHGSLTVITDQVAYELSADDLTYQHELKDLFLDGTPAGFAPRLRANIDSNSSSDGSRPATFIANADGKLYTRVMGANYLGGKFLTEPYELDAKGYQITYFGSGLFGGSFPCYDALNRRVLMASTWREDVKVGPGPYDTKRVSRTRLTPLEDAGDLKLSGFDEGFELLGIYGANHILWGGAQGTTLLYMIYYRENGVVYGRSFRVDNRSLISSLPAFQRNAMLTFNIDATCPMLITANARSGNEARAARLRHFFTTLDDNKLRYLQYDPGYFDTSSRMIEFPFEFPSRITALAYDAISFHEIMVGCENGDIYLFNVENIRAPRLVTKQNCGGKVMTLKQLNMRTSTVDNY